MGEAAVPIEGVVYEEAGNHQPLLVVLGCIYREKKKELRQGITSFTKLPACFGSNETFILVCADGALSQQGVQHVAKKYMTLIGETWKGRDEQQQRFWEDERRVQQTWFGAVKCGACYFCIVSAMIAAVLLSVAMYPLSIL